MIDSMTGADKSRVSTALCLLLIAVLSGCSLPPLQAPRPTPRPPPVSPFADSSVSFLIQGNFARGEQVLVRVCLRADHSIDSSDILESSGDQRFDEMALDWARRVQLRTAGVSGRPVARCGSVRVELHETGAPGMGHPIGERLG
jgi:TonB family protein